MKRLALAMLLLVPYSMFARQAKIGRHAPSEVPGRFMVLLSDDAPPSSYEGIVTSLAATYECTILTRWREAPRGFICENLSETALSRMATDPRVTLIEADFEFSSVWSAVQWTYYNGQYLWHLDRLDERSFTGGAPGTQSDGQYDMCPEAQSIYVYQIDQGVRTDHEQLAYAGGRVIYSVSFDDNSTSGYIDTTNGCTTPNLYVDMWHGTSVASVLAGTQTGAAKTKIVSLRTANCTGTGYASWVVNSVRWIRSVNDPYRFDASLVNYSGAVPGWFTADSSALSTTVDNLVSATHIPFFAAADNFAGDACSFAPNDRAYTNVNKAGKVFVVGGTSLGAGSDQSDYRWQEWASGLPKLGSQGGSNGGRCVSMYAPAYGIYAARSSATNAYGTASGTSYSCPLAAAVAARFMERTGNRAYSAVYDYLLNAAASTGTVVNNINTAEYWYCRATTGLPPAEYTYTYDPGQCPVNYVGVNNTRVPFHFPGTYNESAAGIIFSDMTCS